MTKAMATCRGLILLTLGGCDTSPDVVSFNTPELCEINRTNIASFTVAQEACTGACLICIESTYDDQALTYALTSDDNCVCPAPRVVAAQDVDAAVVDAQTAPTEIGDAHLDTGVAPASDAGASDSSDAGAVAGQPQIAPDGCHSQLNLSLAGAAAYCEGKRDCEVCVERVDFDDEPRRYMAHECGCPSPYRVEQSAFPIRVPRDALL